MKLYIQDIKDVEHFITILRQFMVSGMNFNLDINCVSLQSGLTFKAKKIWREDIEPDLIELEAVRMLWFTKSYDDEDNYFTFIGEAIAWVEKCLAVEKNEIEVVFNIVEE